MIWGGGGNPKQTIQMGRKEQGRELVKKHLKRQPENANTTGSQQSKARHSEHNSATRLNFMYQGYICYLNTGVHLTCLHEEMRDTLLYSHFCTSMQNHCFSHHDPGFQLISKPVGQ